MSSSILSGNNPQFLFQNQSIVQKFYTPLIYYGLDYLYSSQIDKLSSSNSNQLAMYGGACSIATKLINDNILQNLVTQNNLYFISKNGTEVLIGPIFNAFLYLWLTRNFKNNIAYYNGSDFQTLLKGGL